MKKYSGLKKIDNRPTMAEWPVRIWSREEIPAEYKEIVENWMKKDFSDYQFIFSPKRQSSDQSFEYLFGYGENEILYLKGTEAGIVKSVVERGEIRSVKTFRELLKAEITINYEKKEQAEQLAFPYVPSTYYLYDPFLNWLLGIEREFNTVMAERQHPRPQKLYDESLVMYNYSLHAYRLGDGFVDYTYRCEKYRPKWTPWKVLKKEWLEVPMERGDFRLYSFEYVTECVYLLKK